MKYIIDVPNNGYVSEEDGCLYIPLRSDGCDPCMVNPTWLLTGYHAEPYIEPDRKAIEDEVWELARIITSMNIQDYRQCFGEDAALVMTYQEAKAKYDAWKKRKDEIRVGDEVIYNGDRVVVTDIFLQDITRLWIEGVTSSGKTVEALESDIKKTGRHFAEIEELLKKLGGE